MEHSFFASAIQLEYGPYKLPAGSSIRPASGKYASAQPQQKLWITVSLPALSNLNNC